MVLVEIDYTNAPKVNGGSKLDIKQFLKDLCEACGVSGYEQEIGQIAAEAFRPYCSDIRHDKLGNVVCLKRGSGEVRPKILLAAHMDEIGLMVTKIEKGGFLRFTSVGGIDPRTVVGQEVTICVKEKPVGVIGAKPPHLTADEDTGKAHKMDDLHIDLAMPEDRVKTLVSVGDAAVIRRSMQFLAGGRIAAKALDDRAGVAVLLSCLQELERLVHTADVYMVATVQEEVGVRGATVATYNVVPDLGIAVDVTHAEMPGVPEHETCKMGKGASITIGPNIHHKVGEELIRTAKEHRIPYQLEVWPGPTGTDARAIQITRGGIPTGLVSIPLRYMHTSVELLDMEDIKQAGRLLAYFIAGTDPAFVEGLKCC